MPPQEPSPDRTQKKKGFFGAPGTFSRKANIGCLVLVLAFIGFLFFTRYPSYLGYRQAAIVSMPIQSLSAVMKYCDEYWQKNPAGVCTLAKAEGKLKQMGLYTDQVILVILNGRKNQFLVTAKHKKGDKLFLLDHSGTVYLKIKDCLLDVNKVSPRLSIQELEQECVKRKASP